MTVAPSSQSPMARASTTARVISTLMSRERLRTANQALRAISQPPERMATPYRGQLTARGKPARASAKPSRVSSPEAAVRMSRWRRCQKDGGGASSAFSVRGVMWISRRAWARASGLLRCITVSFWATRLKSRSSTPGSAPSLARIKAISSSQSISGM
jgi:hypothetical protein